MAALLGAEMASAPIFLQNVKMGGGYGPTQEWRNDA
jgi:hypothetical protein